MLINDNKSININQILILKVKIKIYIKIYIISFYGNLFDFFIT
jgi:hypothetical protein